MNRDIYTEKGYHFHIGNYTPRRNEYERGLKYKLFFYSVERDGEEILYPTSSCFSTLKEAKDHIIRNYGNIKKMKK